MSEPLASLLLVAERMFHSMYRDIERQLDIDMPHHGLSGIQALLLHRSGTQVVKPSSIIFLGYYRRTNPSYNLSHLRKLGFVKRVAASSDRRETFFQATPRGLQVAAIVERYFSRKGNSVERYAGIGATGITQIIESLERVESGLAAEHGFIG